MLYKTSGTLNVSPYNILQKAATSFTSPGSKNKREPGSGSLRPRRIYNVFANKSLKEIFYGKFCLTTCHNNWWWCIFCKSWIYVVLMLSWKFVLVPIRLFRLFFFFFTAIAVFKRIPLTTSSPHFSAGRIERTKREHTWKSPVARKASCRLSRVGWFSRAQFC